MLQDIPWGELLEALFRRRRTVLLVTLIVFGVVLLSVWLSPASYRTTARIQLTADPVSGPREEAMSDQQVQAELAFLRSPILIGRVLTRFGESTEDRGVDPSTRSRLLELRKRLSGGVAALGGASEADRLEQRIRSAASRIEVAPVGRSNLVEIAFLSSNPRFAADFVNGLLQEHMKRISELSKESPELPFIESQLETLAERWQQARTALDSFRNRYGSSVLDGDEAQLRSLIGQLEAQRVASETKVLELRARVQYLSEQKLTYPETVESELRMTEPEAVKILRGRITELQMERSEALTRYTPDSVAVRQLERQIEEAERLLDSKEKEAFSESATARNPAIDALEVEQLKTVAELKAAEARAAALSGQIVDYRDRLSELEVAVVELERLQNGVESAQESYQEFLREAEITRKEAAREEFGMVNIAVIEAAEPPRISEPSRARIKIISGGLVALFLGMLVAVARDWMDPSVKSAAQARRLTGLRVLAEVPNQ